MTIGEALAASKLNGRAYARGGGLWVRYDPDFVYRLSAEDLMADDWQLVGEPTEER